MQIYTSDLLMLETCWLETNNNRNRTFMQSDKDVSEVCGSVRMM